MLFMAKKNGKENGVCRVYKNVIYRAVNYDSSSVYYAISYEKNF